MLMLKRRGKEKKILRKELPVFFNIVPFVSPNTLTDLH